MSAFSKDTQVFLPLSNFLKVFGSERSIDLHVKILPDVNKEDAKLELVGVFRQIRRVPADK